MRVKGRQSKKIWAVDGNRGDLNIFHSNFGTVFIGLKILVSRQIQFKTLKILLPILLLLMPCLATDSPLLLPHQIPSRPLLAIQHICGLSLWAESWLPSVGLGDVSGVGSWVWWWGKACVCVWVGGAVSVEMVCISVAGFSSWSRCWVWRQRGNGLLQDLRKSTVNHLSNLS